MRGSVEHLLDSLPSMYAANRTMDSALGPALEAAYLISQHVGGKVVVVQACLPTLGPGKLKPREGPRMLGGDKEHTLFAPDASDDGLLYKTKAVDFSKQQLSVDFFLFNPHYSDVATLGSLSRYTAGQVYWYGPSYSPASDGARFAADLERDLTRNTGFEAVMRVRATKGVNIANFYGNFFIRGTDLLALPNVTCDTAFNVELALDPEALAPGSIVSVQAALLYTTSGGERRIAVHTLARPVTSILADLFRNVDCDALVNTMAKIALDNTLRHGLTAARRYLHNTLVDVMRAYKASASSGLSGHGALAMNSGSLSRLPMGAAGPGGGGGGGGPPGPGASTALSLPECLALLPLYSMGLQKSVAFRGGDVIRSDERSYLSYRMLSMAVVESRPFVFPRLFSLHDMETAAGMPDAELGEVAQPHPHAGPRVRLPALAASVSAAALSPGGAYLLDSGFEMFLWLGREVPAGLVAALFGERGVPSGQGSDPAAALLERPQENLFAKRVVAIVRTLRAEAVSTQRLRVVQEGTNDVNEARFQWYLVEDRQNYSGGGCTYEEYVAIASKEAQMPAMGGQGGVQMGGGIGGG
jgi:protein transport protein SEC24